MPSYFLAMGDKAGSISWTELGEERGPMRAKLLRSQLRVEAKEQRQDKIDFYIPNVKLTLARIIERAHFLGSCVVGLGIFGAGEPDTE